MAEYDPNPWFDRLREVAVTRCITTASHVAVLGPYRLTCRYCKVVTRPSNREDITHCGNCGAPFADPLNK